MAFQGALYYSLCVVVVLWCVRALVRASMGTLFPGTDSRCGNCGYGLSGLAGTKPDRCPECGRELLAAGITTPRTRGAGAPGMGSAIVALFVLSCMAALIAGRQMSMRSTRTFFAGTTVDQYRPRGPERVLGTGFEATYVVSGVADVTSGVSATGTVAFRTLGVTPVQTVVVALDGTVASSTLPAIPAGGTFGQPEATTFVQAAKLPEPSSTATADASLLLLEFVTAVRQDPLGRAVGSGPAYGLDQSRLRHDIKYQPGVTLGPLRGNAAILARISLVIAPIDVIVLWMIHRSRKRGRTRPNERSSFEIMGAAPTPGPPRCCESMTRHANRPADRPDQPIIIAHDDGSQFAFLRGLDLVEIACCPWCGTSLGRQKA